MTSFYFSSFIVVITITLSLFCCFWIFYRDSVFIQLLYNVIICILHSFVYVANNEITHHKHHSCIQILSSFRHFCSRHNSVIVSRSLNNFISYILCYLAIQIFLECLINSWKIISWMPIVCIIQSYVQTRIY